MTKVEKYFERDSWICLVVEEERMSTKLPNARKEDPNSDRVRNKEAKSEPTLRRAIISCWLGQSRSEDRIFFLAKTIKMSFAEKFFTKDYLIGDYDWKFLCHPRFPFFNKGKVYQPPPFCEYKACLRLRT